MEKHFLETTFKSYRLEPTFLNKVLSLVIALVLIGSVMTSYAFYNKGLNNGQVFYINNLSKEQSTREDFIAAQEAQVIETLVKSGYLRDDIHADYSVQDAAHQAAELYPVEGVDMYALLLSVAKIETGIKNLSTTNASGTYCGYCAISTSAAINYMRLCDCWDLMCAEDNFKVAACILQSHINKYGLDGGLSMYNGAGNKSSSYSRTVLGYYNSYINLFETVPTTYTGQKVETAEGEGE